jgi:amidohydrolase
MDTQNTRQSIKSEIKRLAESQSVRLLKIRKHLHQHPELSFAEINTSKYLCAQLAEWDIPYTAGWAGHGIIATIDAGRSTTIALRADMDALPIFETSTHDYVSTIPGCMHACGHDVHMTCLLGAAYILHNMKEHLSHNITLVFQPGEEKLPGGASIMLAEGAIDNPKPSHIFGQHVFPSLEVGKVGIRSGLYMASADEIYLTVKGRGGHAATPHENIDTVLVSSAIIVALQSLVARYANPAIPSVLSFGKINSVGGATNVIPDVVHIEGTFRTMDETWRQAAHRIIETIARDTAQSYGAVCEVDMHIGYPCLINDEHLCHNVKSQMIEYLGKENVVDLPIRMTSEDFAFYSQVIPGCFYRLGTGNAAKGIKAPVHTSTFDIDNEALVVGAGLMAWLAMSE